MAKYYYLISGLPNISLDDGKLAYSVADFWREIEGQLSCRDRRLIRLFYLKYDNRNLLSYITGSGQDPDARGEIGMDEIEALHKALKNEEALPKNKRIPAYFKTFLELYLAEERKERKTDEGMSVAWEDRLSALYYAFAMDCGNRFISDWYELNLNINNILTAITCRKYNFDKANYIVGDNHVAESIRNSNARDFGLSDSVEYLPELQRIAEEMDLVAREKKIDLLKWQWLDDNTFFKTFDIESVFAYLLKLEMIERWVVLDKARGEKTFRVIVSVMKKGGENALDEFKRNNNK